MLEDTLRKRENAEDLSLSQKKRKCTKDRSPHSTSSNIAACDNASPVAYPPKPESCEALSSESTSSAPTATASGSKASHSQSPGQNVNFDAPRWSPTTSTPFQALLMRHQKIPANVLVSSSPLCRMRTLTSTIYQEDGATGEDSVNTGNAPIVKLRFPNTARNGYISTGINSTTSDETALAPLSPPNRSVSTSLSYRRPGSQADASSTTVAEGSSSQDTDGATSPVSSARITNVPKLEPEPDTSLRSAPTGFANTLSFLQRVKGEVDRVLKRVYDDDAKLQAAINELQQAKSSAELAEAKHRAALDELRVQRDLARAYADVMQKKFDDITSKAMELRREDKARYQAQESELRTELEKCQKTAEDLRADITQLYAENAKLHAENAGLHMELKDLRNESAVLKTELRRMSSERAWASLSAISTVFDEGVESEPAPVPEPLSSPQRNLRPPTPPWTSTSAKRTSPETWR